MSHSARAIKEGRAFLDANVAGHLVTPKIVWQGSEGEKEQEMLQAAPNAKRAHDEESIIGTGSVLFLARYGTRKRVECCQRWQKRGSGCV